MEYFLSITQMLGISFDNMSYGLLEELAKQPIDLQSVLHGIHAVDAGNESADTTNYEWIIIFVLIICFFGQALASLPHDTKQ